MKTNGHDILASHDELKKTPYSVPEGYFEAFKAEASRTYSRPVAGPWRKAVPYMAAAASFALLLSLGAMFLQKSAQDDILTQEDYILFSDNLISTAIYEEYDQVAEADLMEEEIIEYLIYTGVSPETIELSK